MTVIDLKERLLGLSLWQKRQLVRFLTDSLGNRQIEASQSETIPLSVFLQQSP